MLDIVGASSTTDPMNILNRYQWISPALKIEVEDNRISAKGVRFLFDENLLSAP